MHSECSFYELLCVVANYGMADKVVKTAKQNGVLGATVFYGRGIIKSAVLSFLGLDDSRKEIIWMLADKRFAENTAEALVKRFSFQKPNHGIAFCIPITNAWGLGIDTCDVAEKQEGMVMNKVIFTIVEKGEAEAVVEAATKAGARGGTIINARGSGVHETSKVFLMDIEPEREIVMILAKTNITDNIVAAIKEVAKPNKPGGGVVFVQNVGKTYGIYS
ncbi:MAG: P-II family nitrogen regulator [Firmicutes bacterium]|nr:P-II family nitrogen regulator [Bacillota bacterium]